MSFLKDLLNRKLIVTISDTRQFEGVMMCTDSNGTVILSDSIETRLGRRREVGLIVVPGKHIKRVQIRDEYS